MQLPLLKNVLRPSALLSHSSKVSIRPSATFIRNDKKPLIEILDEAALKRRPNRNAGLIIPDKTRLWGAAITRAKYKRHDMPYYGKPTTLTALVLDSVYTSDFMQDGICSRVGESSCVLFLVYAISFPIK